MKPKLTVGMTTHDDYDGVYFTVQGLRLNHREVLDQMEFIIVDQNPGSAYGALTKRFADGIGARYFPQTDLKGPPHGRNLYFKEATARNVLSVDCHVLFENGSIAKLIEYFEMYSQTPDLLHGPLVYDDMQNVSTHWRPEWKPGAQNYGSWDTDKRGLDPNAAPFEIPFSGVGVMACRKDAWVGYNKDFIGFGAEEWYIHRKFRQAGGTVLCLPFLRWIHRFGRMPHANYPLELWKKTYNHLLGSLELGDMDDVAYQLQHWNTISPGCLAQALEELTKRGYVGVEN